MAPTIKTGTYILEEIGIISRPQTVISAINMLELAFIAYVSKVSNMYKVLFDISLYIF